jgi:hypothetical protein
MFFKHAVGEFFFFWRLHRQLNHCPRVINKDHVYHAAGVQIFTGIIAKETVDIIYTGIFFLSIEVHAKILPSFLHLFHINFRRSANLSMEHKFRW